MSFFVFMASLLKYLSEDHVLFFSEDVLFSQVSAWLDEMELRRETWPQAPDYMYFLLSHFQFSLLQA